MKNIPVHPSPLYSVFKNIFILVVVNAVFYKFPVIGLPTALWLMLYGVLRFIIDFTRFIQPPYFWGLRFSQLFSLIVFGWGFYLILNIGSTQYQFVHTFANGLMNSVNYLGFSLIGTLIVFLAYGYHGRTLGHYFTPKK